MVILLSSILFDAYVSSRSTFSFRWLHAVSPVAMPFLSFCLRHSCSQSFLIPHSFYAVLVVAENKKGS